MRISADRQFILPQILFYLVCGKEVDTQKKKMSIRKIARSKINFKDVLVATGNRILIFTATFFLDKKSSQKSQDGGILSTRKAGAGLRRGGPSTCPHRTIEIQFKQLCFGI